MAEDRTVRQATGRVWYADGLRFTCQPDCGACCTDHGEYAYVYLRGDDLERIAGYLGMTPAEFEREHTTTDGGERILKMDEPDCPFLEGARCSVYPVRPAQCRSFPFWERNLESRADWDRLSEFCPGINRGETHCLLRIRARLSPSEES